MIVAAWIFGGLGVLFNALIYQQTSRKRILSTKRIADCLWTAHYVFLSAFSGAGICAIGILRETVFLKEDKKWAQGKRWLIFFLLLSIISAILTWKNAFSILPTAAAALSVFSFWKGDPKLTKILSYPISACFMIYNLTCLSYMGIVNEMIVLVSTTVGLIRILKKDMR